MAKSKKPCDLCGLDVESDEFHLITADGELEFCCAGCLGIFKLLNEVEELPPASSRTQSKQNR